MYTVGEYKAKIYSTMTNGNIIVEFRPKQKWLINKIGDNYWINRDNVSINITKESVNHIFGLRL